MWSGWSRCSWSARVAPHRHRHLRRSAGDSTPSVAPTPIVAVRRSACTRQRGRRRVSAASQRVAPAATSPTAAATHRVQMAVALAALTRGRHVAPAAIAADRLPARTASARRPPVATPPGRRAAPAPTAARFRARAACAVAARPATPVQGPARSREVAPTTAGMARSVSGRAQHATMPATWDAARTLIAWGFATPAAPNSSATRSSRAKRSASAGASEGFDPGTVSDHPTDLLFFVAWTRWTARFAPSDVA
jgi:hypothetical protein